MDNKPTVPLNITARAAIVNSDTEFTVARLTKVLGEIKNSERLICTILERISEEANHGKLNHSI